MNKPSAKKNPFLRWLPIVILAAILILAYIFNWYHYLSFTALSQHHKELIQWTHQHYAAAIFIFMSIYIIAVATSFPGASILTITGGFLFGIVPGAIYVVIGATLGACVLFIAVKTALGEWLRQKAKGWIKRMEDGFNRDAFNYLLFIRLVPVFPFWAVNIVAALLNVKFRQFFFATLIGIIPGTVVYAAIGNGLGALFEKGQTPNFSIIFEPQILFPILALALLSLVPIVYKKVKARKK